MSMQPPYPQAIPLSQLDQFMLGHLVPVESTYCTHIAYLADRAAIRVRYDDGETWRYFPFDRSAALSLWHAPSKGQWFWGFVRVRGPGHIHDHRSGAAKEEP